MVKKSSLNDLLLYFLVLGAIGFGGSIALTRSMQKDVVEKKKWLTEDEFLRGLTLAQLAPGPLAAQLAIYIGYVQANILGATVAGIAFVLPSFLIVLAIGMVYAHLGSVSFMQSALYGIGAAVIGIIASSGYSLTKRTMKKKTLLWIIYLFSFFITVITKSTNILFFLGAGTITMLVYSKEKLSSPINELIIFPYFTSIPSFFVYFMSLPLFQLFLFFFLAGSIAFGGGLAIVPFLQHGVVTQYHWLTNKQFVDAVSIAMITPGPVVIAATFIGYMAANIPGAIVATLAIFLPVYLIVIFLTPLFTRHAENPKMIAFIEGVIAAAMASIAGSVVLLGSESITDVITVCIAILSFLGTKLFKIPGVLIILISGLIGVLLH